MSRSGVIFQRSMAHGRTGTAPLSAAGAEEHLLTFVKKDNAGEYYG